ncbi:carboxypeptidase-like regulatory domain-containing protein [Flavobacterium sp. LHD-80]|uniref:Kelch repeat-containing protein n=1 Tax=Flavobacterium sp. LHD-80 TaxID=3071411 RepID=UPI0027E1C950|nr:carboxypeptidase-like regulatory domain-containing protein [Flavobacterium sp. LHD-80]MDQ6472382.1 carboxypeptidase-like regulatory domain-containing protein [Flavobacterium sp. LHD-80]
MKKLLFVFLLIPLLSSAQIPKGIVSTVNNEPLEGVNVFALSSKIGTVTNKKGEFSTLSFSNLKADEIIEFSHIGYTTTRFSLRYLAKHKFKIHLEESIENLSGVTIAPNAKPITSLLFKNLSPLKNPIFSFGSILKDGKIYVSGGDAYSEIDYLERGRTLKAAYNMDDYLVEPAKPKRHYKKYLSIYDIGTDTWETSKLNLKARGYHNLHYYNNLIYVLGGKRILVNSISSWEYLEDQIEVIDLDKPTIKLDNTNPHQAVDFASFTYKDNIIVMGGSLKRSEKDKKEFTNKVHLYNITSGNWYELEPMPTAKETTGILINDKIYLIGGNDGKAISEIETFDLITEKWETEGQLFSELERPAITYHENIIYFFEDQKMYAYNIKTKQLKEYDIDIQLKYTAMHYYNDKLYLLGGRFENSYSKIPSSKVFSIDLEEFKNTRPSRIKILGQEKNLAKSNY